MTTLKQGDLITSIGGEAYKILEVWGNILFISCSYDHESYGFTANEEWLKARGYTWDTPAWEPEIGDRYWFIHADGEPSPCQANWENDKHDHARKNFLGIYQTKELAEAALLEIRRKLGK